MTIQSSIQELGLFDLLQLLHINKKTGRLVIRGGPDGKQAEIAFKKGDVGFAAVHDRVPKTIEALLVEWGVVDNASLGRIEKGRRKYATLVDCLEGEGIASRGHIDSFIANCVREHLYEIFKWDRGECRFIEEELDERREVLVPLNTENLILEGARRIDEWSNIGNKVPSRHSVFVLSVESQQGRELNLKPREWEILALIDGKRSVKEVNDAVGGDLFTTSKLIYGLVIMGVIELVGGGAASGAPSPQKEARLEDLLKAGRELYGRLNLDGAAAEFEKVLAIDPECFEALRMLGEIYYKTDRLSDALVHISKARNLKPDNQKAMFIKGYLHARLGEVSSAIAEWEELKEKANNPQIVDLVSKKVSLAREWEKVLQEY